MWSRARKSAVISLVVLAAVLAAAQLVRPEQSNPATDPTHTIQSRIGTNSALAAVVHRSCRDCHSNATEWRWYTEVAPLSWIMARAVSDGRKAVNFSEWTAYSPSQRRTLLAMSCLDATRGMMPMEAYLRFRPDAKLSTRDVEAICAASRQPEPSVANNSAPNPENER